MAIYGIKVIAVDGLRSRRSSRRYGLRRWSMDGFDGSMLLGWMDSMLLDGTICSTRIIVESPSSVTVEQAIRFGFKASNNQAEYEAVLDDLKLEQELEANQVKIYSNSQLVVNQLTGDYNTKETTIKRYAQ
ncbi:Retrovirus-related Pol polyprotein from transposon 17.6 [Senna tora]|uniref:Retrovirus-related Pol polyprotein from transposon 17.6 n=1 Tax=Senna tora TaxID=362788 RepID=A0A834TFL2_9FABA|nr:Retrovirus-related Pol polyprotein from transposon 17.6 [Senna tora]